MNKIAIVVHGGAGPDSDYIKENETGYKKGLEDAVNAGYAILEKGGGAIDAVEAAVCILENNPLFNAGRGSALNANAEVEMCASVMNGKDQRSGAVAIVKNVKNPVSLARAVMEKTEHIYLGSQGAMQFAQEIEAPLEPDSYFITEHQYEAFDEKRREAKGDQRKIAMLQVERRMHGTVGAVAVDAKGNVASATSTGGTEFNSPGRIGDSSMIGVGTYANNNTCAVSTTGDGEYLIQQVGGFHLSAVMEYKHLPLQQACKYLFEEKWKELEGDMGMIAVDPQGNIAAEFNAERMHRGWKSSDTPLEVHIY